MLGIALNTKSFTAALMLATGFFYDWMKIFSAQDVSSALNRWNRELRLQKLYCWLNSIQRSLGAPPSNELGTRFFQTLKKVSMARDKLFRVVMLKLSCFSHVILVDVFCGKTNQPDQ